MGRACTTHGGEKECIQGFGTKTKKIETSIATVLSFYCSYMPAPVELLTLFRVVSRL
jgi:hypothetical protein